jgi:hypothetical protein
MGVYAREGNSILLHVDLLVGTNVRGIEVLAYHGILVDLPVWLCRCSNCSSTFRSCARDVNSSRRAPCGCPRARKVPVAREPREKQNDKVSARRAHNTPFDHLWCRYRSSARSRGITWDLDVDEAAKLLSGDCYICGRPPLQELKWRGTITKYNGIDRLDSSAGYVLGNVDSCCRACNYRKLDSSLDELVSWARIIVRRFCSK